MTTIRTFLPKCRALFSNFLKKDRGDPPPDSPLSSYAPAIKFNKAWAL